MENESPKKRPSFILRVLFFLIIVMAAYFGYLLYFSSQRAGVTGQQVNPSVAVFDTRMENLEKGTLSHEERLKALEEKISNGASATSSSPTTSTDPAAADDPRIAALEKEIIGLKAASPMQSAESVKQAIRMLSAFHRLSGKVLSGKPFSTELSAFEELVKPDESAGSAVTMLAPYADSGIPTFATLLGTFDQSLDNMNAALSVPPANAGFWERFVYNLTHLVSIRRIDETQTGASQQAIVGRAQSHLERQEIEAAVEEIKSLPESARGNFASWLDDAQMVAEAPSYIDQLQEQVMLKAFHTEAPTPAKQPESVTPTPTP